MPGEERAVPSAPAESMAVSQRAQLLKLNLNKFGPTMVLLAILLLGYGLRLYRLGDQNIWWDEGHAVWSARHSMREVTDITAHDVHPPLYLWMLHGWMQLVGESEFALRYLSLIGGLLTVALTYVVARRLTGRRPALLATLLIAAARFHIWWSQEARMYIWAAFLALLSIYFFTRVRQHRLAWWAYVISSAAAIYTLYLAVLVLVLENVFVAITVWRKPQRRRFLSHWTTAQAAIGLAYVPWLYLALSFSRTGAADSQFPFGLVWQLYGTVLVTGISTDLGQYAPLVIAFVPLVLLGLGFYVFDRHQPQRYGFAGREMGLFLLLSLFLPPLLVYALSVPRGMFYSPKPEARYLLLFAPTFYILVAGTLANLWEVKWWGRVVTVVGTLLVLGTFVSMLPSYYVGRYLRDDYQTAMVTLEAYAQPDDAVLLVSGDRYPVFLYYYQQHFGKDGPTIYLLPRYGDPMSEGNVGLELEPLATQYDRLWLASFERALQDPENVTETWLEAHRTRVLHVSEGYNYLRLYARQELQPLGSLDRCYPEHTFDPPQQLSPQVKLLGYDQPTHEFRPGDVVRPGLYLQAEEASEVEVQWIHESGQVIEKQMLDLPRVEGTRTYVRLMPAYAVYDYTPPGRYEVLVAVPGKEGGAVRVPAGQVTQSRHLPSWPMEVAYPISLDEGCIQLKGYTMQPAQVHAGEPLQVDLFWQAQCTLTHDYTVFVHLLGPYNPATGGPVWAQDDSYPLQGGHPTSRWIAGQTVPDRHPLELPASMPAGTYQVEVGLYDASTGARVPVDVVSEDRILIEEVSVAAP
jgi:mannosyltransferase